MKEWKTGPAEDGPHFRERLTRSLRGVPAWFCGHAGPLQAIESRADELDVAAERRDREMNLKLLEHQRDQLQEVLAALHRIETGRYGICENCGGEIGLGRLRVSPATSLCIECKREEEDRAKRKALPFRTVSCCPG